MSGLVGLLNYFDQKRGQEAYGNLLNEYRVPGDPNTPNPGPYAIGSPEMDQALMQQQGGFRGQGGLLSGGPPQEFYMRAAQLPGYQQLAQQAMVGQQAMERQMQGQQWEANNMSLAQKTQLDLTQQQQQWQRQRQEFEWNNPSAVQNAQIQNARGHLGVAQAGQKLQQQRFNAEFMPDPNNPKGFVPRPVQQVPKVPVGYQVTSDGAMVPIPGTDDWRKGQADITSLQEGAAGAKQLAEHLTKFGTAEMWNRDAATVANVHRNAAITGLGVLSNMGVLQPGDLDRLSAQLADPTDYGPSALISRRDPAIAAAKEVAKRLEDAASATSSRFKGQSAPANSAKVLTYNPKTGRLE